MANVDAWDTENSTVDDSPQMEHKRLTLSCVIIGLWIVLGLLGILFKTHFYDLSIYFISLTGFVGAYVISETKRPALETTLFKSGANSKREVIIYVVVLLWLILGVFGVMDSIDLLEAAAYFSALTPYISTYLIGIAYKPELPKSARENMARNDMYNYGAYSTNPAQVVNVVAKPVDPIDP